MMAALLLANSACHPAQTQSASPSAPPTSPSPSSATSPGRLGISFGDLLAPPLPPADARIAYGDLPQQFGELRMPKGRGPFPVAVIIHGGCWLSQYDVRHAAGEAAALTAQGIATWSIEYRRVGDEGGGWPGTFEDAARATDHLTQLASTHALDLKRVVLVGHSAGGQLALWLASRVRHSGTAPNVAATLPIVGRAPLAVRGVVSLAGVTDMRTFGARPGGCSAAVASVLGGTAAAQSARYDAMSPVALLPLGVPVRLLHGTADSAVPDAQSSDYAVRARAAGDDATAVIFPGAGHFDVVSPQSAVWPRVVQSVRELLGMR